MSKVVILLSVVISMEKAFNSIGQLVLAKDAHKNIGKYICPCCWDEVFKAEGKIQSAHFRHRSGGKKEYCDLYTQGLGNLYNPFDYASVMRRPYITFEEKNEEWDFYIKFPKIPKGLTRMFEDFNMYFNVSCREMQAKVSSVHLRHDSNSNKLKVMPKESYHFSIDIREYADRLQLRWPERINGFMEDIYLFTFIHGEFVMMEKNKVSLNDTFYLVSKKNLTFHQTLTVQSLKRRNGWLAYKVQLPNVLDDTLRNWFYKKLGFELKYPFYYLDLLEPSIYNRLSSAYAINDNTCSVGVTFRDFQYEKLTVIHIHPDMTSTQHLLINNVNEFSDLEQGFHTFYIKNHEGKILNIYVDGEKHSHTVVNYENKLVIDGESKVIFKDKKINIKNSATVKHDFPFEVWRKSTKSFPQPLKGKENKLTTDDAETYIPGIWNFKVLSESKHDDLQLDTEALLLLYLKISQKKPAVITNKQYNELICLIENMTDSSRKQKLKYFIRLHRNKVPVDIKRILKNLKQISRDNVIERDY